jgi:predicted SnoaL-like aldol condensation-catalyzing enzyme
MKTGFPLPTILLAIFSIPFVFGSTALAQANSISNEDLHRNKKIVERYFFEVVDRLGVGDAASEQWKAQADEVEKVIDQLFTEKAIQHFPGAPASDPKELLVHIRQGSTKSMKTIIHHLAAESDLVSVHISHDLTPKRGEMMARPRIGCQVQFSGDTIHWEAMAFFRMENGKIAEEWISRDDLGMLLQLGEIVFEPCVPLAKK